LDESFAANSIDRGLFAVKAVGISTDFERMFIAARAYPSGCVHCDLYYDAWTTAHTSIISVDQDDGSPHCESHCKLLLYRRDWM
jgi:hypothetical protein